MAPQKVTGTGLRRIPIAHPAVMAVSWMTIAGLLYWGYGTGLQQPRPWIGSSVALLITIAGVLSHRRRARARPPAVETTGPVLDIDRS